MTDPKVRYLRKIGGTPVEALAHYAILENIENGWRNPERTIPGTGWDKEAVYIEVAGIPVAMLGFGRSEWNRTINTQWSYTLPAYRKKGLNRSLFDALKHIAKRDGYHTITRGTHPANTKMVEAFKAAGGALTHVEYNFSTDADVSISLNDRYEFP